MSVHVLQYTVIYYKKNIEHQHDVLVHEVVQL